MWYLHPDILINIKISRIDGEYYISSFHEKERKCNPEEIIRQFLYIKLICHYGFSQERIRIEYPIQIGSTKRRADIVVLNNEMHPYVIAETKVKMTEDSIAQLQSYINVTRANYGIVASQSEIAFFQSINDSLNSINDIPTSYRPIVDIFTRKEQPSDMMGFQKLYRINDENSIVVINDTQFSIRNNGLLSYNSIKKIALSKGIVLPLNINDNRWHQIVTKLFESAEDVKGLEGYDILNLNDVTEISILREIIVEMIARFKSDYQESGDEASAITQHCVVRKDKTVYIRIDSIMDALQFCRSKVLQKAEQNEVLKMLKTIGFVRVDSPIWFSSARKGEGKLHRVWRIKLHQILTEKEIAIYESQGT